MTNNNSELPHFKTKELYDTLHQAKQLLNRQKERIILARKVSSDFTTKDRQIEIVLCFFGRLKPIPTSHLTIDYFEIDNDYQSNEFATWIYNHETGSFGLGHYFQTIQEAIKDFRART